MKCVLFILYSLLLCFYFYSCKENKADTIDFELIKQNQVVDTTHYTYSWLDSYNPNSSIFNTIFPPDGYKRSTEEKNSFGAWLQRLPINTTDNTVYLFNGEKKYNQQAQHAVLDIDVGEKDLQQCADAIMRLRAEYLYATKQFDKIQFNYTNGVTIPFSKWNKGFYPKLQENKVVWVSANNDASYKSFKKYLTNIFTYAGTASLSKEMKSIAIKEMTIGDVFILGGHPGHAVIVVDMTFNKTTNDRCFMLAQSYMPAQSIHILKNPRNERLSPWYSLSEINNEIRTPEWTFNVTQLKRFIK
ncbi:MAG: hypothetical protein CVT95_03205 [Bacteroidetes bacterium HGW-Bacteroidetes-12]|nr:MAG: hypothetical protein CVT95_03205 [Bacteroidetes bacterium HGW-Bacteroidetes-12]